MTAIVQAALAGQVAVVTGGGRGLGLVYGKALASAGAKVALFARSRTQLETAVASVRAEDRQVTGILADVVDADSVGNGFATLEEVFGPVDILVNNAGSGGPLGMAWKVDDNDWWRSIETHVRGTFLCTQMALRQMEKRHRGRVINIVSHAGAHRWPTASAYSVAKAAQIKFTENVAVEARPIGVKLFAFHPGLVIDVGMSRDALVRGAVAGSAQAEVIAWIEKERASGRTVHAELGASRIIALASGRFDLLSGRYLTVHDDLDTLLEQAERIRRTDALVLRIRDVPDA